MEAVMRLRLAFLTVGFVVIVTGCRPWVMDPSYRLKDVTGDGVLVAVIDLPIQEDHPLFDVGTGRVWLHPKSERLTPDVGGHGMKLASAVKRVAPGADIVVFGKDPNPGFGYPIPEQNRDLVNRAIDEGADVIVMASSSTDDVFRRFRGAINRAEDEGVLVVTSAGNHGNKTLCPEGFIGWEEENKLYDPQGWDNPNILVVGGIEELPPVHQPVWTRWRCSVHGEGVDVYTNTQTSGLADLDNATQNGNGTSSATGLMAGTAALLIEKDESLRGDPERLTRFIQLLGREQYDNCEQSPSCDIQTSPPTTRPT